MLPSSTPPETAIKAPPWAEGTPTVHKHLPYERSPLAHYDGLDECPLTLTAQQRADLVRAFRDATARSATLELLLNETRAAYSSLDAAWACALRRVEVEAARTLRDSVAAAQAAFVEDISKREAAKPVVATAETQTLVTEFVCAATQVRRAPPPRTDVELETVRNPILPRVTMPTKDVVLQDPETAAVADRGIQPPEGLPCALLCRWRALLAAHGAVAALAAEAAPRAELLAARLRVVETRLRFEQQGKVTAQETAARREVEAEWHSRLLEALNLIAIEARKQWHRVEADVHNARRFLISRMEADRLSDDPSDGVVP